MDRKKLYICTICLVTAVLFIGAWNQMPVRHWEQNELTNYLTLYSKRDHKYYPIENNLLISNQNTVKKITMPVLRGVGQRGLRLCGPLSRPAGGL